MRAVMVSKTEHFFSSPEPPVPTDGRWPLRKGCHVAVWLVPCLPANGCPGLSRPLIAKGRVGFLLSSTESRAGSGLRDLEGPVNIQAS